MLSLLHIENIALIESADIRFGPGFNALTGETGAGKSIVIDSISAVLGERTSRDLIRTGAKSAFVSAVFCALPALEWFARTGVQPDENGELLLEREIQADGRNACRVNGRPLTVAQLKALGQQLLNIHGQHDGQQLLDEGCHLDYLDRFGNVEPWLSAYREPYQALAETRREIQSLQMDDAEKSRRIDTLTYQIGELERAKLKPGEDEELAARKSFLRNAGKMISALEEADYALDGGGEVEGALSLLSTAANALGRAARCVEQGSDQAASLAEIAQRLSEMQMEAYDALEVARDLRGELDVSPEDIDRMESRLDQLYRLEKKYGSTVEEMLNYLERCREELDQIQYSSDRIEQLEKKLAAHRREAEKRGRALTRARREAADRLQARIQSELSDLDMPKVRFEVEIVPKTGGLGMDATGMDQVRFLMSANV
ncbi:MAG: AAA family ATPase, partial [Oscillospiraceae bacterium]|nr:AAA family ATPase [Oscillospiraceae bacterium]